MASGTAGGRIAPGVGANLIGQHAQDRNQEATVYVGNLDPQVAHLGFNVNLGWHIMSVSSVISGDVRCPSQCTFCFLHEAATAERPRLLLPFLTCPRSCMGLDLVLAADWFGSAHFKA